MSGYSSVSLKKVCVFKNGFAFKSSKFRTSGTPILRIGNIKNDIIEPAGTPFASSDDYAEDLSRYIVEPTDIVIAMSGATTGKVAKNTTKITFYQNQRVGKFIPSATLNKDYLFNFLKTKVREALKMSLGSAQPNLSTQQINDFKIPLPPLPEQKRIVKKLDTCQGHIDRSKSALDAIPQLLEDYRATADWRAQQKAQGIQHESAEELLTRLRQEREARYQQQLDDWQLTIQNWEANGKVGRKPSKPRRPVRSIAIHPEKQSHLPTLPSKWSWVSFDEICDFINGDRGKNYPNRSEYVTSGIPWINTGHIEPDGSLSSAKMNFITRQKFESLNGGHIKSGDLVYCLRGATFGKTAFVKPYKEGAIASSLMIVRPIIIESTNCIYHYLLSPLGKTQLKRFDNGTAQPNLSANSVRSYEFPLCSIAEQKEIVARLEAAFKRIEDIKLLHSKLSTQHSDLTQSLLAKAFRGELLPQKIKHN